MTIEVKVPSLPESVSDGTLVNWKKKPGDPVKRGENLPVLVTLQNIQGVRETATFNVPVPASAKPGKAVLLVGDGLDINDVALPKRHLSEVRSEAALTIRNTGATEAQVLLLQARPIREPVASYGPFVMNTPEQIQQTFVDFQRTRFGGWPYPDGAPTHGDEVRRFAVYPGGQESTPGA